jgi:hypothetical protein
MSKPKVLTAAATMLAAFGVLTLIAQDPVFAQSEGAGWPFVWRDLPYHAWYYDGRDDRRDFPTNGSFPGNFAADPARAAIGAAGLFGFTPEHANPLLVDGSYRADCARRYRSYDAATGYFLGYDGARHRCR